MVFYFDKGRSRSPPRNFNKCQCLFSIRVKGVLNVKEQVAAFNQERDFYVARWIVYSSIYSPFVHPLHRHLRRDGLVKDPLHICLCEYLWTCSSAAADTRLLPPGRRCDHDSNVRRLLISDGWICWEYHCRPQPEICQHLCRDDLCILLSRYLLTLRFTILHNLQFRYTKYVCSKIPDTSTSLFSVENAILVPRPGLGTETSWRLPPHPEYSIIPLPSDAAIHIFVKTKGYRPQLSKHS